MVRSFEKILRLAKRAAEFALDKDEGYDRMRFLALEEGMRRETLEYYANAYQAAGESGVRALSYKKKMPESIRAEAVKAVNEFLLNRLPKNLPAGTIWFQSVAKDNHITALEKRPLFSAPKQSSAIEIFQIRYTDYDQRWHLYWKRASGKWWPYIGKKEMKSVKDCLREVTDDDSGCFRG
ncbi:MAG: DUF3024 domain-containing protein [Candidatus Omnitrophota bacterium]